MVAIFVSKRLEKAVLFLIEVNGDCGSVSVSSNVSERTWHVAERKSSCG